MTHEVFASTFVLDFFMYVLCILHGLLSRTTNVKHKYINNIL